MVLAYKVERSYNNGGSDCRYYDFYHEALEAYNRGDTYLARCTLSKVFAETLADYLNYNGHCEELQDRTTRDGY